MRFSIVCAYLLLQVSISFAQFTEIFDYQLIDSTFPWKGTDTAWQLNGGRLQSHYGLPNSTFYIARPSLAAGNATWESWMWLNFNTSSLNYVDIYLMADTANLLASRIKGYFIRIGNTKDEICLYRKDSATSTLLIDGRDGITDHSSNILSIKVIRNRENEWTLWANEVLEGRARDSIYQHSRYMGFIVRQSTASFFNRHYIDNVVVSADLDTIQVDKYDVLINEILPGRFVELRNNSEHAIQLNGWRVGNARQELILPFYLLQPDSLLVLYDTLPKDNDVITLYNNKGRLIHAVGYDTSWYINGRSLEMISASWPCAGRSNWQSSALGGTPGTYYATEDVTFPVSLQRAYMYDTLTVQLFFSGTLDSLTAINKAKYSLPVSKIIVSPPLYNIITLHLQEPLHADTISIEGLTDCTGRTVIAGKTAVTQPVLPDSLDVIINEVLYDGTVEFVELYNRSNKSIPMQQLYLNGKALEEGILSPGQFAAFTSDPVELCILYNCINTCKANIPVLKNGEGDVILSRSDGKLLDKFHYSDELHFIMGINTKGVSLERLDPDAPTQDKYNWHSAASTSGYATPGRKNSQWLPPAGGVGTFTVTPDVFSPDNDGKDDVAVINYNLPAPGYVANVMVFDAAGRLVRLLEKNVLLSPGGRIFWDGRGDGNCMLTTGIYVLFIEVFEPGGRTGSWKLPLVLAKRVN